MKMNSDQKITQHKDLWMSFVINISFVILLFFLGVFIGLFLSNKHLIEDELLTRARSHFQNIIYTRLWNARHGGVYVEKKPGMISNPYLENQDITDQQGKVYTKKNPAMMTREISELASGEDNYHFHITSLKPLNPDNAADAFEKKALEAFETGRQEIFGKHEEGGRFFYRYMAPLYTEKSCLACHAKQGYKEGDVRGGISISFNIDEVEKTINYNKYIVVALFVITSLTLLAIVYFFIVKLNRRLSVALDKIQELAITDPLSGLYNRRFLMQRLNEEIKRAQSYQHPLSCILLDIDFFKRVNDTYGHLAGDAVLSYISALLKKNSRKADILARFGGEEFILVLPETGTEEARKIAENIRLHISSQKIPISNFIQLDITASLGVTGFDSQTAERVSEVDQLVNAADQALYRAKEKGRNRSEYQPLFAD